MTTAAVTVYSTPTCGYCHMAKQYFKSKGVDYKDIDLTQDVSAQMWVLNKTGQLAVPVIDIGDNIIIGFDRERIDLALRDKKLI